MATVNLKHIRKLAKAIDEGHLSDDGASALYELREIAENLMKCAQNVIDRWECGDLAGAVNDLRAQKEYAEIGQEMTRHSWVGNTAFEKITGIKWVCMNCGMSSKTACRQRDCPGKQ